MLQKQILALLLALLSLVAGCDSSLSARTDTPSLIRIGASYWPGQYWADIANHKGWFKEAGLNVQMVDTNADYFASFDQVVDGKLDIVAFTLFDLTLYRARGKALTGFMASDYSSGADVLVARNGIHTVRDLQGKKLGLAQGTYVAYIWSVLAGRHDLKAGKVQIVEVSGEKASEALSSGRVDAVFTWEPFAQEAVTSVKGNRLFDTSQIPGISWAIYSARNDFLRQRPADVHLLMQVWQRTEDFIRKQPAQAYAIVAEVNHKTVAEVMAFARLDKTLNPSENRAAFSYASGFDSLHGSVRRMNDFQIESGLTSIQVDTPSMLDSRFVDDLTRRAASADHVR
jgi:NitT/TauT family transport system substrate-binding protein